MAGIAGMVSPTDDIMQKSVNICAMSEAIRSRGASGAGHFISPHAAILRRIGSAGAKNEMSFVSELVIEGKTYVLSLDGTIFNYKEFCSDLNIPEINCDAVSCSDLLIYAYVKFKEDFLSKINGSFAFALWIQEDSKLILARDHHGTKPLYYTITDKTLIFASDIRGITCHPMFETKLDTEGLSELICLSPRHTPGCGVIKGIHQVRPGHFIQFTTDGFKSKRYWIMEKQEHEDDLAKTLETVRELVVDSVQRKMKSDQPLCGLLSGGLYSSLITAIAADNPKLLNSNTYNTWSVDFERSSRYIRQRGFGIETDTPWIRWVCRRAGTRHHYIILSPSDMIESLLDAEEARGIPGMPDNDTSLLLLFREIQKDFCIVLSGDCSDEIFGTSLKASEHFVTGRKRLPWSSNLAEKISVLKYDIIDMIKPYEFIEKCYEEALAEYPKFAVYENHLRKENEAQWFSLYWNLPCLLDRLDRMSMACGLEVRVPFCDVRITDYFWNIPQELKQLNNMDRGLLREALRGYLPSDILERKKAPYPRLQDPEYEAKLKNMLFETVLDPCSPVKYMLNIKTLESMMKQQPNTCKSFLARTQLYGWIIQLNHFLRMNGITTF
ncbi:MAG: asparagine synthase (glutamine-hydrolyzing) [Acetivibrionales bacterium]|jgi:asparagine synthase (glutamine-hydrolysing)